MASTSLFRPRSAACGFALQDGVKRAGSGETREERRIVTVLFADLAGSTALGERLDPEDVRELQGELFQFLNGEVERHGGMTEKFVGDAVMAIFGVPQSHEDDPERAIRAALGLRDAFPEFATRVRLRHGLQVGLRIGVNTGEVVSGREAAARGELVVSGDSVNVAARLQQCAGTGEILVGTRTHAAAQRAVVFEGPRQIEAKGKDNPVEAWVAVKLAPRPTRRGVEGLSASLVGRDAELGVLTALAARVERERAPQLVTLFGQAGVGKSRLLEELVEQLGAGARLLKGRCLPYGDGITYWPLAEVAKSHAGVLETDSAADAIEKLRHTIEAVVPADQTAAVFEATSWTIGLSLPGAEPTGFGSADVGGRLRNAWARYVAALGRERFTVLAIEDIHWASQPLLDLLDHIADTLQETQVLIVCPTRPELLDLRPGWGAGKQNATALNLQPLGLQDSRRLVEELLHVDEVGDEVRARILERAGGNPFFVEEILRMLIDSGALERRNGGWAATTNLGEIPLPDSVHGVIAARIDLLDAASREALRRCAVMGRTFWPLAVGVEEEVAGTLARRGLVSEQPSSVMAGMREFSFKHALTRDVAYETLPRHERRTLHRLIGEWIEQVAPGGRATEMAEIAAYHYVAAIRYGENDPAAAAHAFDLLLAAGEASLSRAALASAESLLGQALELAATPEARCRALIGLARSVTGAARYEEALRSLDEASELAQQAAAPALKADVLSWQTRVAWLAGRWNDALAAAQEAVAILDGLPESPELARALARRSQIEMLRGLPAAEPHSAEAIEVARRVGDHFAEANARINLATARSMRGAKPDETEMLDIVDNAVEAGAHDEGFRAIVNYLWSANLISSLDDAERTVDEALARLGGVDQIESYDEYLLLSRAKFLWIPSGRWANVDLVVAAPETSSGGGNRIVWLEIVAGTLLRRGELHRADALLPELRRTAIESGEPQRILPMAGIVLPRAAQTGDRATLLDITSVILTLPGRGYWTLITSPAIPRALAQAEEHDALQRFADALDDGRDVGSTRITRRTCGGFIALAHGQLDDAVGSFREAVNLERAHGAHYSAACAELDLALALDATGNEREAEKVRANAAMVLLPLGCTNAL